MALDCKFSYLMFFLTVGATGFDFSSLGVDHSLNPRLIGAVYQLYKPMLTPTKVSPITIDCNHPSVVCKFGTVTLISPPNKECDCKDSSDVPIVTGLTTGQEDKNTDSADIKTDGDKVSLISNGKNSEVPIYKGVVDTDAILNEAEKPYNIWNFQRNSLDKGWRNSDDSAKTRVGEIPRKFYSYYPFSQPPVPDDYSVRYTPDMVGQTPFSPSWRRPGPVVLPAYPQLPTFSQQNLPTKQNLKTSTIKTDIYSTSSEEESLITPKSVSESEKESVAKTT
ncbi:uncharacterized protein LOC142333673 [Lycorma delicatula]|uniref:uncharacterized protein LOC142333673 n=1 Tax=Lycorma delicatula TaxID=130591 RepID=UPI003F51827D